MSSGQRHVSTVTGGLRSQNPKLFSLDDITSLQKRAKSKDSQSFPYFPKLPLELRTMIWELVAEEPRVLIVRARSNQGLCASIPPILHICSESRAIGLENYSYAFKEEESEYVEASTSDEKVNMISPGIYFNFERDTLYFPQTWNKDAKGAWSCLETIADWRGPADLRKVQRIGLDVEVSVCPSNHPLRLSAFDEIETLYLGYTEIRLRDKGPISFGELESDSYDEFMERYKMNRCWRLLQPAGDLPLEEVETIENLRGEVATSSYHWQNLKKVEPVRIEYL